MYLFQIVKELAIFAVNSTFPSSIPNKVPEYKTIMYNRLGKH